MNFTQTINNPQALSTHPENRSKVDSGVRIYLAPVVEQIRLSPVENKIEPRELLISCEKGDKVGVTIPAEFLEYFYLAFEHRPVS